MKKLITLVVAGCMVLGSLGTAAAIDVKVAGQWFFHYGYYSNNTLTEKKDTGEHTDRTRARQRVRTQIQFIADENLSAMLNLEANMNWGSTTEGVNKAHGGLDADRTTFVVKRAHLDWTLPNTQIKTRMGMQGIAMPSVTFGNPVMDADVAGISVSTQFSPAVGLTAFWARPYDSSWDTTNQTGGSNLYDEMDVFGFTLPIKTDVVRFTPWGMFAFIGTDSDFYQKSPYNYHGTGVRTTNMDKQAYGYWFGSTFELPVLDPFFVKVDALAGGLKTGDSDYNTFGWMVAGDIGYKFSWGALSAIGWYATGNEDDDDHGFLPVISDDGGFGPTRYGMSGGTARSFDRVLSGTGIGMWGMGVKVADVSFVEDLKHTFTAMYMGGTNEGDSINRRSVRDNVADSSFGGQYLMSSDRAWEIDLLNEYKVNEYLKFNVDFAYVWLDLGDHWTDKDDTKGSFATMVGVTYSF